MKTRRARGLKLRLKGLGAWRGFHTTRWLMAAAAAPRGAREGMREMGCCWGAGLRPNRRWKKPVGGGEEGGWVGGWVGRGRGHQTSEWVLVECLGIAESLATNGRCLAT